MVINYALRFPAELRQGGVVVNGFFDNWATNFKLGSDFVIGPRNEDRDDGGEPPGYIPVIIKEIRLWQNKTNAKEYQNQ